MMQSVGRWYLTLLPEISLVPSMCHLYHLIHIGIIKLVFKLPRRRPITPVTLIHEPLGRCGTPSAQRDPKCTALSGAESELSETPLWTSLGAFCFSVRCSVRRSVRERLLLSEALSQGQ